MVSEITAVGVGLEAGNLTFQAVEALKSGARVILHTGRIGCADWLEAAGVPFETLDKLYDSCEDFDEHAVLAAEHVIDAARDGNVIYAVYDVRDLSVLKLMERAKDVRVIPGPPVEGALFARLDGATRLLEASDWANFHLSAMDNALVRELNSRELASEVKLKLMDCYPEESVCFILDGEGRVSRCPLYDLDRMKAYDHRTCALVPAQRDFTRLERYGFEQLVQIMHVLQGPGGCPWDREQTHESLRPFMLEETYEAIDAINEGDAAHLSEELGDILMQVVMQAEIGMRHGEFDIRDAISNICRKMIDRHSHIFGRDNASGADAVLDLWAKNKMRERGQQRYTETLKEVAHSLPALMRGEKLMEKARRAGMVGETGEIQGDVLSLLKKLDACENPEAVLGDCLLMLCALCRNLGVDAEIALNEAADLFVQRFQTLENEAEAAGKTLPAGENEAKEYWNRVKLRKNTFIRQELED